ncbi:MAG: tetratricopeptide repeat protein [Bacteroidales bacterium]|nr:tetratricopeptide repeat protein [Bacteroidales bacterium]
MKKLHLTGLLLCLLMAAAGISCRHNGTNDAGQGADSTLTKWYKVLAKHPGDAEAHMHLSDYYRDHLLLDSALNHALAAIRSDSTNAGYYVKLSDLYLAMKEPDLCENVLNKALRINPSHEEAYLKLAELHFLYQHYEEASEVIQKALTINDFNPKAYFIQGWILREQGDTAAAVRAYLKAAEQNSRYFEAYEELAHLYHLRHNPLAVDYYKNALSVRPDDPQTLYNLAMFYQETGNDDQAIAQYQRLLQLDPDNKFVQHNMGWIYLTHKERYEDAVRCFTNAITQDTTFLEAVYNRGLAFECLGDYASARQDFAYTLHLDATYEPAIEGLNRLDKKERRK